MSRPYAELHLHLHSHWALFAAELVLRGPDTWRIDDEWWRERPVSRAYFEVALEDGRTVTVYKDLVGGQWARQSY